MKAGAGSGRTVLVDGISGTLGLGVCLIALGLGVNRILGIGRNPDLLADVKALAPERIEVLPAGAASLAEWVKGQAGGDGVDIVIDALGPGAPAEAMLEAIASLGRGRRAGRHRRDDGTPRARSVLDDVLAAQRGRLPVVFHRGSPGHGRRVSAGPLGSRTPPSRCPRSTKPSTPSPNGTGASPTSFACRESRADGLPAVKTPFPTVPRRCHEHIHASSA